MWDTLSNEPLSNISLSCSLISFNSTSVILYGGIETRRVSGMMYIPKSISLSGGNPSISSRKTSENSLTVENYWRGGTSPLESLSRTMLEIILFETNFLSLRYEMKWPLSIVELLLHFMTGSLRIWNLLTQIL